MVSPVDIVRYMLRVAQASSNDPADQKTYLLNLASGQWNVLKTDGDVQIIAHSIAGKQFQFSVQSGLSKQDILGYAETALQYQEAGLYPSIQAQISFN